MTSGYSLGQDLKLLINNPKYSDVEILCGDENILYGCKAILAARSKIFDKLLFNGMIDSYENQISFPTINYSGMEIILEYVYTGSVEEESLTKDNVIESLNAADYFQLPDLQDLIIKNLEIILEKNCEENYSPELLSKAVDIMPLLEDNPLLNLLVEAVAIIPLNTIEFGRLSITALEYLLSYCEKERFFVTPEYEVFRYSAILAAKKVSNNAYTALMKQLPTLEQIEQQLIQIENRLFIDHQKVAEELKPLIKFIDFRRFKGQVLDDIIKPLKIIPTEIILNADQDNTKLFQFNLNDIQEIPMQLDKFNEIDYVWDESTCGSKLIIEANGKVVSASNDCNFNQSVRSKIALGNEGIFEWDVIIEKTCAQAWIGVCASGNLNYEENLAIYQPTGWVISSNGCYYNFKSWSNHCPSFGNGTRITVCLDMNKKACTFTVNGKRYPEVSEWKDLSSKLYPMVSLRHPGRFRIESTRSRKEKGFYESLQDML